jgi:hypothetical protein
VRGRKPREHRKPKRQPFAPAGAFFGVSKKIKAKNQGSSEVGKAFGFLVFLGFLFLPPDALYHSLIRRGSLANGNSE